MAFTIPNLADVGEDAEQAEIDSKDIDILVQGINKTGVVSGCGVTAQGVPDMTVAVAAGEIAYIDTAATVTGGNATIEAADGTNARFDLIMVTNAGALVNPTAGNGKGTAAAEPVFPTIPANRVVLAVVLIPALDAAIGAGQIVDKRVIIQMPDTAITVVHRSNADVIIENSSAEASLYSYTIPGGNLGATGGIRVTVVGDFINNTGAAKTLQFRIKLGAESGLLTGNTGILANATWRPWRLVVEFMNSNAAVQNWSGQLRLGLGRSETFPYQQLDFGLYWDQYAGVGMLNTGAVDTESNQLLDVRAKLGAAHNALIVARRSAFIERFPPA